MENTAIKQKIGITTLGCKVNQYESAALVEKLCAKKYTLVPFNSPADIYIINTCTVTSSADFQSRQLIRRAKKNNPQAKIIVTGCFAQISPEKIKKIDETIIIVGNEQKDMIPEFIEDSTLIGRDVTEYYGSCSKIFHYMPLGKFTNHTRAFLKIQDGCDSYCSYCIIPYARGEKRSLFPPMALTAIDRFIKNDYREIVFTGIHLGAYGQDLIPSTNLEQLLKDVINIDSSTRFRLSSIEPIEITDNLLNLFAKNASLCPHLHIPLQSGDDKILRLMRRNYDTSFYRNLINKITAAVEDVAIGIDVMVGFPGEGTNEFNNTVRFLESLPVAYIHIFPYSERPNTAAANIHPKINVKTKKERALFLKKINELKRMQFARRFLGKELFVLVENTKDKKTRLLKGVSQNYLPVLLENCDQSFVNKIVAVRVQKLEEGKLYGKIVS